jgi:hypothetical protein
MAIYALERRNHKMIVRLWISGEEIGLMKKAVAEAILRVHMRLYPKTPAWYEQLEPAAQ